MKPLRRKKAYEVTIDPLTGQKRILKSTQEDNILSDQGSVDTDQLSEVFFLDCGCNTNQGVGGRCFECQAISCPLHHGQCQSCQKPLCMQHSIFLDTESQAKIRFCRYCYDKITRRQKWTKAGRFFLSLFVDGGSNG